jgi:hypothetical protein
MSLLEIVSYRLIDSDGVFHPYFMISVMRCMLEKNQLNVDNVDFLKRMPGTIQFG